jgi:hypothetical protein
MFGQLTRRSNAVRRAALAASIAAHSVCVAWVLCQPRYRLECEVLPPLAMSPMLKTVARASTERRISEEPLFRAPFHFPQRATILAGRLGYAGAVRIEYRVRRGKLVNVRVTRGVPPPALARELLAWTRRHSAPNTDQRASVFHFEPRVAEATSDSVPPRLFFRCGHVFFQHDDPTWIHLPRCHAEPIDEEDALSGGASGGAGVSRSL